MSVVADVVAIPKGIIKPILNPTTLLIGVGVTAVSLLLLSNVFSGIGAMVGLRVNPWLPKLSNSLAFFPFVPMQGSGGGSVTSAGARQEAAGNAIVVICKSFGEKPTSRECAFGARRESK